MAHMRRAVPKKKLLDQQLDLAEVDCIRRSFGMVGCRQVNSDGMQLLRCGFCCSL
jgi:hypothetical protein